ncbi:hypothetical protein ACFL10_00895 [Patescibacteria group bacterium]
MSSETSKNPALQLVGDNLTLAQIAKQATKAAEDERTAKAEAEEERVDGLLSRITTINEQVAEAIKIVRATDVELKNSVIAQLEGPRTALENEKAEILNDPGVQLAHLQLLTQEVQNTERWDDVTEITEDAVSRGWFKKPKLNKKKNINFRALEVPETASKAVKDAAYELKRAINLKITELAKVSNKKKSQGRPEAFNPPKLVTTQQKRPESKVSSKPEKPIF